MNNPIIGYIVIGSHEAKELCFGAHCPPCGLLLTGDNVTVFATRRRAQGAIQRTIKSVHDECEKAGREPYAWAQKHKYQIKPLRAATGGGA